MIGAVDGAGTLLGFASWGTFRAFPAYKYTVEHSIYVHHEHRGRGLGVRLLEEVVRRAREAQVHVLVGCIDASNAGSIGLHTRLGFVHAGTIQQVGFVRALARCRLLSAHAGDAGLPGGWLRRARIAPRHFEAVAAQ